MTDRSSATGGDPRRSLNEAGRAWREGRFRDAEAHCHAALEAAPDHPGGCALAGVIAHRLGNFDDARRHLEHAVALAPDDPGHRQNLAMVLLDAADPPAALGHLDVVLEREPDNLHARELRAEALAQAGDLEQAIGAWRAVLDGSPGHPTAHSRLLELLSRIPPEKPNPVIDELIGSLLDSDRVEPNMLAIPVARRVMARHRLTGGAGVAPALEALAADEMFLKALSRLYFTEPVFDAALTALRRELLLGCHAQGRLPGGWQRLVAALAVHEQRCEHVHFAAADERETVARIAERLEAALASGDASPAALAGPLLLVSLYRSPDELAGTGQLAAVAAGDWPEPVQPLMRMVFAEPRREEALAARIEALAEIGDETSSAVRAMYEAHPYPRWERLGPVVPGSVAERLQLQLPGYRSPAFAGGERVAVLIAGCGTGRHALRAALEYTNARVLAVDISRRSLAYAVRKADELDVDNVAFMQADLFHLPRLKRRFHVIETIGTLETLDDPGAGWEVLAGLLEPGGLMYVGSYSETARIPVVRARERIRELGLEGSDDDIRDFRRRVFEGELGEHGRVLVRCGDFYSLSGCRDFLFHVKESRFTIRQLSRIWQSCGLRFLGFHPIRPPMREAYARRFPEDRFARELDNWIAFEEGEPDEFCRLMNLSMLYYWLEKHA